MKIQAMMQDADASGQEEACACTLSRFTGWLTEIRDEQPYWRGVADREADYYDGNQLDAATLRDMQDIGMPPIVENVIGPAIDAVLGMEAKTRTDWKVGAENDFRATPIAEAMGHKLAEAEKASRADRACSDAYAQEVKVGIGWVEVSRESDPFRYPYRVTSVHRNEIFWDMRSREPDGSDMRFLIRRRWTDVDVAERMFPRHKATIRAVGSGGSLWDEQLTVDGSASTDLAMNLDNMRGWSIEETEWRDVQRGRVCIFEVWYRDWVRGLVLQTPDGRVVEYDPHNQAHVAAVASGVVEPRYAVFAKVRMAYWLGPHRLHDGPSPYKHNRIPYVAFWGKKEDRTGVPYGLVRPMVPMQDAINASESKMQWLLAAKRITQTEGATVDDEETVRREAARPDAHFVLDAERMRNGGVFKVESDFALNQQQYQRLLDKRESVKRVSGVYDAMMGTGSSGQSGLALNTLVEQSTQTLAEINDNYRFARSEVGELLLSLIIEDMGTAQHVVEIKGALPGDEPRQIALNVPSVDEMGIQYLDNDVQRARLKVALSDVPSSPSFRSQQLAAISEVTKSLPPAMQAVVVPFVLALTDIPNRDDVIKAIKGVMDGQAFTLEQVQQQVQQAVAQALEASNREIEKYKLALDERRIAVEERKTEMESFDQKARAHVDNLKAEADWLRAEIEDRRQRADEARIAAEAAKDPAPDPMPVDPMMLPEVITARIAAEKDIEIARIEAATAKREPAEDDGEEVRRLEARLDEVMQAIKQIDERKPDDDGMAKVLQAIASQPKPEAPIVHVTIEKGGQVRKEIEIKSPTGQTYKGTVVQDEE